MTCSPFDLKDFRFGELSGGDRKFVERHLAGCIACQEELAALEATCSAVLCLREEEPVRRIAFVSDKVFEPRWWRKLMMPGARLGFASAALLAIAIVFHALYQPQPVSSPQTGARVEPAAIEFEVARRVQAAVETAVAETEMRQEERLAVLNARLARAERRYNLVLESAAHYVEMNEKQTALGYRNAMMSRDSLGAIQ